MLRASGASAAQPHAWRTARFQVSLQLCPPRSPCRGPTHSRLVRLLLSCSACPRALAAPAWMKFHCRLGRHTHTRDHAGQGGAQERGDSSQESLGVLPREGDLAGQGPGL